MKPEEERMESLQEFYEENKEDLIRQLREDLDAEHIPEDDETLENWYKPCLLEIAKDWYDQDQENDKYIRDVKDGIN